MMFIAIENMGSAFGHKDSNTRNKPEVKGQNKTQLQRHATAKEKLYEERRALAKSAGFDPRFDPSEGNFLFAAKLLAEKRKDTCRYGVAGSLKSLLKRAAFEAQNARTTFDTLMFVGHGNTGVMTVGIGCMPLDQLQSVKGRKAQETFDGLKLDNRMINVANSDTWLGLFDEHRACFAPSRGDDTFHVVFAGCSTGNKSEKSYKHLTHVAAAALANLFQCQVNAYGTDDEITNDEIEEIITFIETIKGSATGGSGSYALKTGVNLDWVKRP
ncbi:hypothetical protein EV699_11257 [Plasticicumulans lactativorans]|uniref:Uncharacterized protein n=1 Tax=Plasticicumulans lactativorans TaxID=1133106 RepID=A0A4R2L4N9_9GAMM|nr:hypothetical protein [Plasticicumulans lactativorans]TCO80722.1 hypothetical protein EV699_11257 [Plasticicumulans lactativorans]